MFDRWYRLVEDHRQQVGTRALRIYCFNLNVDFVAGIDSLLPPSWTWECIEHGTHVAIRWSDPAERFPSPNGAFAVVLVFALVQVFVHGYIVVDIAWNMEVGNAVRRVVRRIHGEEEANKGFDWMLLATGG